MNLSELSQTAILTLVCRVVETERTTPLFNDPMAVLCLERLLSLSSEAEKNRIYKLKKIYTGIQARDARAGVLRVKSFDGITNHFISSNPGCTVINLACGLDTRYWRIDHEKCKYIELDLPEMIALKRVLLKDQLGYEMMECSVLDKAWIDQVTSNGNCNFLLLAEGLFMYLPKPEAVSLFQEIGRRFNRSQLVLDMAPEKYTKGIWKMFLQLESRVWGLDVSFVFGIKDPTEIESYGNGFKVIGCAKGSVGPIITVSIKAA